MNLSRIFILRPIATALLMIGLALSGLLAYRLLPVAALPQIDYPTIRVSTTYLGASPEIMATLVTAPLERQFGIMAGLEQMSSASAGGSSVITLRFALELPLDVAEQQVQAAINAAGNFLPPDLPGPPLYSKVNPADPPIMTIMVSSTTLALPALEDLADTRIAQKISQLPGVGLVTLSGGQRPAVRIQVNPRALAAAGLTLEDVRTAIISANVNQAKGSFDGPERASIINANDQLRAAAEYANIILAYENGAPLRLQDVADVHQGVENIRLAAYVAHNPAKDAPDIDTAEHLAEQAIVLSVQRQPGANVITVADSVKALLPTLALPGTVDISVLTDRTVTIRAMLKDVQLELFIAFALVAGVIFIFLRNARATIIPVLAVPLSLIGTLGVMYLAGFSLNNLTLMAFIIATGFVVDDAIVVIENISRYLEKGYSPRAAALKGAGQIGFTIISLTFSLVAVLIPLLFMQDVTGRLFREFAVTLAVAILISAFISLTLTPMMCAVLLRQGRTPEKSQSEATVDDQLFFTDQGFFNALLRLYDRTLQAVFRHQGLTLAVAVVTLGMTIFLYVIVPKGFFPVQDTALIQGIAEAPQNISFAAMAKQQAALACLIAQDPAVESATVFVGVDGINDAQNQARFSIALKPLDDRKERAPAVAARLEEMVRSAPSMAGLILYALPVQELTIEDRLARTQYQFTLETLTQDELALWTPRFIEKLTALPQLSGLADNLRNQGKQAYAHIDRDAAGRLGISAAAVSSALYSAFGQRLVSTIFTQTNQYRVVLEAAPEFRASPQDLGRIYVTGASGAAVPLESFVRVEERPIVLTVHRQGQFPAVTLSFNVATGHSLGAAISAINNAQAEMNLPDSLRSTFQGAAHAFYASLDNQIWLLLAAVVAMYIVLGVLYESFIHPVTILSTLPSAGVGALLALLLARMDLGVVSIIGIILLIGIVKKNAIMIIDFALEAERKQGKSPSGAIHQACLLRLRPILMTTMAALLGALPLMLGSGMGSELRRPLGVTMVGGLLLSQVLTLYTTPVIYLFFDKLNRRWGRQADEKNTL